MNVDDLLKLLKKAKKQNKGHWFVEIQIVEDGITYAQPLTGGDIANARDDGCRVWLYLDDKRKLPHWMAQ